MSIYCKGCKKRLGDAREMDIKVPTLSGFAYVERGILECDCGYRINVEDAVSDYHDEMDIVHADIRRKARLEEPEFYK